MAQRIGLVRTVKKLWRAIAVAVQRLILEIGVLLPSKRHSLLGRQVDIDGRCVLALMLRVQSGRKPVPVAADEVRQVRNWPGVQDADASRA